MRRKTQALQDYVRPHIGVTPVGEIEPPEIFHLLSIIENKGMIDTAHMVKQTISQVLRYAVATGRAKRDVSADLDGALKEKDTQHLPAIIEPKKVGKLLRDVNNYPNGMIHIQYALKILPYIFLRSKELRSLKWDYVNFDEGIIDIPKEVMKGKLPHVVPMASQIVTLLNGLREFTGDGEYLFPNIGGRTKKKNPSMSENAINNALRKLGYDTKKEMCGHGFRTVFSTSSHNEKYSSPKSDWIEMQLAHVDKNQVKSSYNRAKYLKQRTGMMQQYADYLDVLRVGANVIPIKRKA